MAPSNLQSLRYSYLRLLCLCLKHSGILTLVPVLSTVPRLRSMLLLATVLLLPLPWDPLFSVPMFFTLKPHFHFLPNLWVFLLKLILSWIVLLCGKHDNYRTFPEHWANRELLNKRVSGCRGIHHCYYKGSIWSWYGLKSCWPSHLIRAWGLSLSIFVQTRSKTFVLEPSH